MITKLLEIREHAAGVYHLQYADSFLYSSSADRFLTRWNLETGTQDKFAIRFEQSVYTFHIQDDVLAAATASGELHFIDLKSRTVLQQANKHESAIFSLCLDEQNDLLFAGDADGQLSVWRWSTQAFLALLPLSCGKIRTLAESEGVLYLGAADGQVYLIATTTLNVLDHFYAHNDGVTAICVHGDFIYTGGKDAHIRKWKKDSFEKVKAIPAHNFAVYKLLLWNDMLLSVSRDKTIKGFSLNLDIRFRLAARDGGHAHSVNSACVIDSNRFATCGDDRRIVIWEKS